MNGAEYIAEFLSRVGSDKVFLLTGGACAFLVDAVARHPRMRYICCQGEQSAAMAADAIWRVSGKVGVAMATSGPGAMNLITGIASSFFDSIPSIHITGQVNMRESAIFLGAAVRQAGFQETKIVEMVRPITKYAVMVRSGEELRRELPKAYEIATSGRMGPVLIDVPMNVQQEEMGTDIHPLPTRGVAPPVPREIRDRLATFLAGGTRPVVLFGGGVGLANVHDEVARWLADVGVPFVSSWAGMTYFDHSQSAGYCGQIGVYGNRGANFILQNADRVLVLGSRLDNRQRSGNTRNFVPGAEVLVFDVDEEELKKYKVDGYQTASIDFRNLPEVLSTVKRIPMSNEWLSYVAEMRSRFLGAEVSEYARRRNSLSPYDVFRRVNECIASDAVVIGDTGASVCWLHQAFRRTKHTLFTSGGNSPMGYALPAAVGAQIARPDRQVVSISGDGGFQLNLQELQTVSQLKLPIVMIIMNNGGYGIIRQFQDSYLGSRYSASSDGYSAPDFRKIADAYEIDYKKIESIDDLTEDIFNATRPVIIDVVIDQNTLIEPKLEMGRPINDQFPYLDDEDFSSCNRFVSFARKK